MITGSQQTLCDVTEAGALDDAIRSWNVAKPNDRSICVRDALERARALGIDARREAGLPEEPAQPEAAAPASPAAQPGGANAPQTEAGSYVTLLSCLNVRSRFGARRGL